MTASPECRVITAFSREEKNAEGGRLYVQHRLLEYGETLSPLLTQPNTFFYICGWRGMEAGILEALEIIAKRQRVDWPTLFERLKGRKTLARGSLLIDLP